MKISQDADLTNQARTCFKTFSLFSGLSQTIIDAFPLTNLYNLDRAEKIEEREGLYIIVDGILLGIRKHHPKNSRSKNNKGPSYTQLHTAGDFTGDNCLINPAYKTFSANQKHTRSLVALSDNATVWYVHTDTLNSFRKKHPPFDLNLLSLLLIKKEELEETCTHRHLGSVQKILILLWKIGVMYREKENSDVTLPTFFTQDVIAQLIGSCREQVNRAFTDPLLQKFVLRNDNGHFLGIKLSRSFLNNPPAV